MRHTFLAGLSFMVLFGAGCSGNAPTPDSLSAVPNLNRGVATRGSSRAASYTESLLHRFKSSPDAASSEAGLIFDAAGNLYGTTIAGGADPSCPGGYNGGCGTALTSDASGKERVLYSFAGKPDASQPFAGLLLDSGNLYGTTASGGNATACYSYGGNGCGTVFKVDKSGVETLLYQFQGNFGSGKGAGNLYGTAQNYGDLKCNKRGGNPGCGTMFKLGPSNKFTVLHDFAGSPDGAVPSESLIIDKKGNLYGTTSFGGDDTCNGGYSCGVAFEIDAAGHESVLYSFTGGRNDGEVPYGGLARDAMGNLYGTTSAAASDPAVRDAASSSS